jgi:hypothetical protein
VPRIVCSSNKLQSTRATKEKAMRDRQRDSQAAHPHPNEEWLLSITDFIASNPLLYVPGFLFLVFLVASK